MITLVLMAFALGMDAFSVGLGMGMFRVRLRQIFHIGLLVGVFHVIMPLLGILAGQFLSQQFGSIASYIGGILLVVLGAQMIWSSISSKETPLLTPVGVGLIMFALSVSLDSFSVGLSLGIYGAKTMLVLLCFGIVATGLTWLGLLVGRKVESWIGTYSEVFGGSILLVFGIKLFFGV